MIMVKLQTEKQNYILIESDRINHVLLKKISRSGQIFSNKYISLYFVI